MYLRKKSALKYIFRILAGVFVACSALAQQITVKGTVYDKDSISPMTYAYAVNKNTSTGTITDEGGKFSLQIHLGDTLAFSYLGYSVTKFFTHLMKDSVKNSALNLKIYLKQKVTELKPILIATHAISKEAKELYEGRIGEYQRGIESPLASPISGLYYTFSKRGKQLQKLSVLYQQLLIEEMKEQRISSEKIRAITGNDTLDTKDFLNNCFLPDQFILSSSDYELLVAVKNCYRNYMELHRKKK